MVRSGFSVLVFFWFTSGKNGQSWTPQFIIGLEGVFSWDASSEASRQTLLEKYTRPFSLLTHEMMYSSCGIFISALCCPAATRNQKQRVLEDFFSTLVFIPRSAFDLFK